MVSVAAASIVAMLLLCSNSLKGDLGSGSPFFLAELSTLVNFILEEKWEQAALERKEGVGG